MTALAKVGAVLRVSDEVLAESDWEREVIRRDEMTRALRRSRITGRVARQIVDFVCGGVA